MYNAKAKPNKVWKWIEICHVFHHFPEKPKVVTGQMEVSNFMHLKIRESHLLETRTFRLYQCEIRTTLDSKRLGQRQSSKMSKTVQTVPSIWIPFLHLANHRKRSSMHYFDNTVRQLFSLQWRSQSPLIRSTRWLHNSNVPFFPTFRHQKANK